MTRKKYFQKRNNKIFALEKYIKGKSVYSRIIRRSTIVLIGTKLSARAWLHKMGRDYISPISQVTVTVKTKYWSCKLEVGPGLSLALRLELNVGSSVVCWEEFLILPDKIEKLNSTFNANRHAMSFPKPNLLSKVTFKMDLCGLGQSRGKCSFNLFAQMF